MPICPHHQQRVWCFAHYLGNGVLGFAVCDRQFDRPATGQGSARVIQQLAMLVVIRADRDDMGAPQGLSYGQRQSEQMVNKSLRDAAKYI